MPPVGVLTVDLPPEIAATWPNMVGESGNISLNLRQKIIVYHSLLSSNIQPHPARAETVGRFKELFQVYFVVGQKA